MYKETFKGSKIIITGHTGFKGSWLSILLNEMGAKVTGLALEPPTTPSHFISAQIGHDIHDLRIDLRDKDNVERMMHEIQPDFVFHLAAQPLVRRSYSDPVSTYASNVMGTLHILESLRKLNHPCVAVLITSDKCYNNVEWIWGYRETDRLGGPDPYSASKGAAELVIRSYVLSFFPKGGNIRIGIGRAGNVIGGGDWAEDRIVPDCVRAWSKSEKAPLRNPQATRPWQHVLEPLSGYLKLAMELSKKSQLHGEPFNFGPPAHQNHTVLELVQEMSKYWDKVRWTEDHNPDAHPYESGLLKLNCDKALHHLQWQAVLNFEETAKLTTEWYQYYYNESKNIRDYTIFQINEYDRLNKLRGVS